jgi:orotate phosphoribosyltransferase
MKDRLFVLMRELALSFGDFTLASGQKSRVYIDARRVYLQGEGLHLIGELFYQELLSLEKQNLRFSASGGLAMGAIPLSCALALTAFQKGRNVPAMIVRKEPKEHGLSLQIEGARGVAKGSRIVLVEDVLTTASSALKAKEALCQSGFLVSHLIALVDREQGGADALGAHGIEMRALFKLRDFEDV